MEAPLDGHKHVDSFLNMFCRSHTCVKIYKVHCYITEDGRVGLSWDCRRYKPAYRVTINKNTVLGIAHLSFKTKHFGKCIRD
jgi:hypothetical protein